MSEGQELEIKGMERLGHYFLHFNCMSQIGFSPFFFFLINEFMYYSLLVALGLRCCVRAFSSCGEWGPRFAAVRRLLTAVASPIVEHWL